MDGEGNVSAEPSYSLSNLGFLSLPGCEIDDSVAFEDNTSLMDSLEVFNNEDNWFPSQKSTSIPSEDSCPLSQSNVSNLKSQSSIIKTEK